MFEGSTESGGVEGLGIVPGAVAEFDRSKGLPVPHIGWNSLQERSEASLHVVWTSNSPYRGVTVILFEL